MAILPISATDIGKHNNSINFSGLKKNKKYSSENNNNSNKSNNLAKVPVMVMIAMTPSMLNAKTPVQYLPISNENIPELYAQPSVEVNDATYVARDEEFQQSYPFDVAFLKTYRKIRGVISGTANGKKTNLVLCSITSRDKGISRVYMVKDNEKNIYENQEPEMITELVYHNIGRDKEYLGAVILKTIYDKHTHEFAGALSREVRLDDKTAQFLLDLTTDDTQYEYDKRFGNIKYSETTNPNTRPVIEY